MKREVGIVQYMDVKLSYNMVEDNFCFICLSLFNLDKSVYRGLEKD